MFLNSSWSFKLKNRIKDVNMETMASCQKRGLIRGLGLALAGLVGANTGAVAFLLALARSL